MLKEEPKDITRLRERIRKEFNGEYAVKICKKCENYWTDPHGNVRTALIISKCKNCLV